MNIYFGIPQILMVVLYGTALLLEAYHHGEPKKNKTYDVKVAIISCIIIFTLLIWGGFFTK